LFDNKTELKIPVKKAILSIAFFLIVLYTFGQEQKVNYLTTFDEKLIHFGFTLGVNTLDFEVRNEHSSNIRSDVAEMIPGFTVGIVSSLRLTRDLDLRFLPGLSFGERQLMYNIQVEENAGYPPYPYFYSIKSTFLDFPFLIKYKARRINNDRPYLVFGPAYRQDISRTGKADLVQLNNGGFYAEIGLGWDHYFTFFRFSAEAKFSIGLTNLLGPPPGNNEPQQYSRAIKSLKSNIFTLCFHFE